MMFQKWFKIMSSVILESTPQNECPIIPIIKEIFNEQAALEF